jgi:predicted  nucleic acid-binding Zn-ribbon protein
MTEEELNDLKREHNKLRAEGCELWERIEVVFERVTELRKQIEAADPDNYDPIRLMRAGFRTWRSRIFTLREPHE